MMSSALFGIKGLDILSKVTVPFVIFICAWGIISISKTGFSQLFSVMPKEPMPFGQVVVTVIGTWMSAGIVAPDISRYAKSQKDAMISI